MLRQFSCIKNPKYYFGFIIVAIEAIFTCLKRSGSHRFEKQENLMVSSKITLCDFVTRKFLKNNLDFIGESMCEIFLTKNSDDFVKKSLQEC